MGKPFDFATLTRRCDDLLKQGQVVPAARLLRSALPRRIPEERVLEVARIARRTGQISLGLRLLAGRVERKAGRSARQAELRAEYAVLLTLNGCVLEAIHLLDNLDLKLHPDALLAKSWCHFELWEHERAVPLLLEYVERQRSPYYRAAGAINLAEAYLAAGNDAAALDLLSRTIPALKKEGFRRLLANALHWRAQAHGRAGQPTRARADLREALSLFGKTSVSDALLIRRQIAFQAAEEARSAGPIQEFREEARVARDWESVRECDFQALRLRFRRSLYERLYFGTPYEAYRRRMAEAFGETRPPREFLWGDRGAPTLDLARRTGPQERKLTRQNNALIDALLRDFYRPVTVGELFARLFPAERFDPRSSPVRVHQCIRRLRRWLAQAKLPLEVLCEGRLYYLRKTGPIAVRIPVEMRRTITLPGPVEALSARFGAEFFTAHDARIALGCSKATACRILSGAEASRRTEKTGKGKNTRYRFVAPPAEAASVSPRNLP